MSSHALVAPLAGVILEAKARVGEAVAPADTLFMVGDLSELWLMVEVYERDLAKVGELGILEEDARGRGDLNRRRLLPPLVPHPLEGPASPAAVADRIAGIVRDLARQEGAALLAGVALGAGGAKPAGVGEADARELQVSHGLARTAGDRDQGFQARHDYLARGHDLAVARLVVEFALGGIGPPVAASPDKGQGVADEEARPIPGDRPGEGVVPGGLGRQGFGPFDVVGGRLIPARRGQACG